ncbi:MAG: aconitate hydratase, partial [Phycisphaerae bacterium]
MNTSKTTNNTFGAKSILSTAQGDLRIYKLPALADAGVGHVDRLPFSIKVLLESVLRNVDGSTITEDDVRALAGWEAKDVAQREIPFIPARVLLQDFTGVPAVVDLAAMRDAMVRLGG